MRFRLPHRLLSISTLKVLCLLLVVWNVLDVSWVHFAYLRQARRASVLPALKEKVYIASIHWNNEAVLRSHWIPAVVELAKYLGPDNVFISVQESGSWDDSKGALQMLDGMLQDAGIRRNIILDDTTHKDEIKKPPGVAGWIRTPRDRMELRRIPYLASLRNLVMEPLYELAANGEHFDKVLFINDVVFTTGDVLRLFNTRRGEYAAACALDFSKPPPFYDTFALRDYNGHDALMQTWPYFRSRTSRSAIKSAQPVSVASCWNGMVVMHAAPFLDKARPLRFRGIPDSLAEHHLEGSECCLIHADNPMSHEKGVWLNPNVRVGYNDRAYEAVKFAPGHPWVSVSTIFWGSWQNRIQRWSTSHWFKESIVHRRLAAWTAENAQNEESGTVCLINEMQVLVENGWAHV